jgi:hypothetical protein
MLKKFTKKEQNHKLIDRKIVKHVQSAFPHIDLSSEGKIKKFMERLIPLMKLKLEGKIKTNKDGSGSFDKRELNKNKETN